LRKHTRMRFEEAREASSMDLMSPAAKAVLASAFSAALDVSGVLEVPTVDQTSPNRGGGGGAGSSLSCNPSMTPPTKSDSNLVAAPGQERSSAAFGLGSTAGGDGLGAGTAATPDDDVRRRLGEEAAPGVSRRSRVSANKVPQVPARRMWVGCLLS